MKSSTHQTIDDALVHLSKLHPYDDEVLEFPDEVLLAKLHEIGIDIDRTLMKTLCSQNVSAEELSRPFEEKFEQELSDGIRNDERDIDWIWIILRTLWGRWFPEEPCFEFLDDHIDAGINLIDVDESGVLSHWREAWKHLHGLLQKCDDTVEALERRTRSEHPFLEWARTFTIYLWNAALEDANFHLERVELCEVLLERSEADWRSVDVQSLRIDMAASLFELAKTNYADELYSKWLEEDPKWGDGWLSWALCYLRDSLGSSAHLNRAIAILKEGLSVEGVRDKIDLMQTLAQIYEECGNYEEANELLRRVVNAKEFQLSMLTYSASTRKTPLPPASKDQSILDLGSNQSYGSRRVENVGRKDPCPCGSGKKYKRCCLGE